MHALQEKINEFFTAFREATGEESVSLDMLESAVLHEIQKYLDSK